MMRLKPRHGAARSLGERRERILRGARVSQDYRRRRRAGCAHRRRQYRRARSERRQRRLRRAAERGRSGPARFVLHARSTRRAGGVGALEGVRTPSLVAKAVMDLTDHHLLVGDGAQQFARNMGFTIEDDLIVMIRSGAPIPAGVLRRMPAGFFAPDESSWRRRCSPECAV